MSPLIEALKRVEEANRQQTEQELKVDFFQQTLSLEQTTENLSFNMSEETLFVVKDDLLHETLFLEESIQNFSFDKQVSEANLSVNNDPLKSNAYTPEWLPLDDFPSQKTAAELPVKKENLAEKVSFSKKTPKQEENKEKIEVKLEKLFHTEDKFSKPWTTEEHAAAAAELQAAHAAGSLKPLWGYLVLLVFMIMVLGSGYFFVSHKVEELSKSSVTTNQVTSLPAGGVAAKLAELHKKSQQEQQITQPQTVVTQLPVVEEKKLASTPNVLSQSEEHLPARAPPRQPKPQPAPVANKRLKIEHNLVTPRVDKRLQEAYQAYQQGHYLSAKKLYLAVLQEDQHNRDALLGLAGISVKNQQVIQAKHYYQQVLKFYPQDPIAEMGLIGLQETDSSDGEIFLKYQLSREPDASHLQFMLGNLYSRQQRWSEAQQAYVEAYRRNSQHPDYAYNLAVSLEHLGKSHAALPYYQRALALSAAHPFNFNLDILQQRIAELENASN